MYCKLRKDEDESLSEQTPIISLDHDRKQNYSAQLVPASTSGVLSL